MTSKERVRAAVEHRQPDRVPIDYQARDEVSAALRELLGVGAADSLEERLGIDLRCVGPAFEPPKASPLCYADPTVEVTGDGTHMDIWGVGFKPNRTALGSYMDLASSPLKGLSSEEELGGYPWPSADMWDYSRVREEAESRADHWVWTHSRGCFEISWFLRGFDRFMMDLAANPGLACAVMDRVLDYLMERTRRVLDAGRGLIDMVEYNDDVGTQGGLLISPDMWRRLLKPRMASFVGLCREYGCVVRYHSCGGIRPIIPDLIEIGVDVLNPVQTLAAGMEAEALKRDFGGRLTLNGGIDTQRLLPNASADQVRQEVRRSIDVLGRSGGYILAPSHVFQPDVPVENVLAVYEAALGRTL